MYKTFTGKNVLGDNTKLVYPGGMLTFHYWQCAMFCDAWETVISRWEASDFHVLVSPCSDLPMLKVLVVDDTD